MLPEEKLYELSMKATRAIGSPQSIFIHTIFFVGIFSLTLFGFTFSEVLLFLTTIVSLEAIYLAIFIQMTVNINTARLNTVSKDVEEIQEDVGEISETVEDLQENVEEIQEDVGEIHENVGDLQDNVEEIHENVEDLQENVEEIQEEKTIEEQSTQKVKSKRRKKKLIQNKPTQFQRKQ